jgi:nucleoside-diphosphate-sugar epimerase
MMDYWSGKKVLVTGGAGMVGSHIAEVLIKRGASVTVADNLKRGRKENLEAIIGRIAFVNADLTDGKTCDAVCAGKDVVLHLASDAYGLSYGYTHHGEILTHNLLVNTNILDASRRNQIKRMLVVSSSCVYRDDAPVPTREQEGFTGEPERANVGYGWSKRVLEIQARHFHQDYGMEIAIVRPVNIYGPRDPMTGKGTHVIPSLIHKTLCKDGPVVVWGSGGQARDFIHVRDVARAMLLLTETYACAEPVNLGSSQSTSIRELITRIVEIAGVKKEIVFDTSKPEGAKNKSVDTTVLNNVCGFTPEIGFAEGLQETIDWCRQEAAR